MKDSVIMEDVVIEENARVSLAIVDSECVIGKNATVGNASGDITVIEKGSVIPEKI